MRWGSMVIAVLSFAACDGPGGGGGGTPQDTVAQDTVFSPTDVVDGSGDTSGGNCVNGQRQCSGQRAQQCVNGNFQDLFTCPSNQVCEAGACKAGDTSDTSVPPDTTPTDTTTTDTQVDTTPDPCAGKECGPNGAGGSCGTCGQNETCNGIGQCVAVCVANCAGKDCGNDGCGGSCGTCDPLDEQCVQGTCEPTEVCDCGGAECGVDNCGNSCGLCGSGESCQGGSCVPDAQGGGCVDLINCIYDDVSGCFSLLPDEDAFNLCAEDCYSSASQTGADEFDAYLGCLQTCPTPDDDPNTTDDDLAYDRCSYQSCSDEEAYCVLDGSGTGTCFGIFDCFDLNCVEGDSDCYKACYEAATPAAQAALWAINNCLAIECPDETDQLCLDDAVAGQCAAFVMECQNN